MILGMNVGFGCRVAVLPSSLIMRQDGETESAHKSLTLFAEVRAGRSAVFNDSNLREICGSDSKGSPPRARNTRGNSHCSAKSA